MCEQWTSGPVCGAVSQTAIVGADNEESDDEGEQQHRDDHVPDGQKDHRVVASVRLLCSRRRLVGIGGRHAVVV